MGMDVSASLVAGVKVNVKEVSKQVTKYDEDTGKPYTTQVLSDEVKICTEDGTEICNNIDEDDIKEDKKEQIKEWFNFVMLMMAKLTQKYKTLMELNKENDNIKEDSLEDNKDSDLGEVPFNKEDLVKA